ncbi:hypothetical protein [Streptomyces sp. NPDC059708]|uniref:hypothetical protein n=1 Tax=Streptomyces sp. NPDC059708 TaxID=3346916 RepID=UPI0036A01607
MPIVKLTVITDLNGTVIGTKQVIDPGSSPAPDFVYRPTAGPGADGPALIVPVYSRITPGPDQKMHEIDVDLPERFFASLDPDALHQVVQEELRHHRGK